MIFRIAEALAAWGFGNCQCDLVAERENSVYRVSTSSGIFALRRHRVGYRSNAELHGELDWISALSEAGLSVPKPVASRAGNLIEMIGGTQVDVITWLSGEQLGETGKDLSIKNSVSVFRLLGAEMAKLHIASDAWQKPSGFQRCEWDRAGLLGDDPLWGRFWENPTLKAEKRDMFVDFRKAANHRLAQVEAELDYGLIHADLVRENILDHDDQLSLIDFDDGGYGFRLFEIATSLFKNIDEPNFDALKSSLIEGYHDIRELDLELLDLFMAIRAATYVGWIVPRLREPGATVRNERFVRNASKLCRHYLDSKR
ncbi:MAG: phosphotransferase [Paracoccaceae bacterium]|jgi:Ser/Thr protein kinase RdoA (MazF antagonist)|nr:phosphotransferase [Paracoccaceae bacterium]